MFNQKLVCKHSLVLNNQKVETTLMPINRWKRMCPGSRVGYYLTLKRKEHQHALPIGWSLKTLCWDALPTDNLWRGCTQQSQPKLPQQTLGFYLDETSRISPWWSQEANAAVRPEAGGRGWGLSSLLDALPLTVACIFPILVVLKGCSLVILLNNSLHCG